MFSVSRKASTVTKSIDDALLGDVAVYAAAAAAGQYASHLALANDPKLPATWEQLVARYTAGSAIVWGVCLTYALRHRNASALDLALLHGGVLAGCGAAVALMHLGDYLRARAIADALDARYDEESGYGDPAPPRRPLSLPRRRGA
jgi:hypothetical protein